MTAKEKKIFHKRKKLNLKVKQDLQIWLLLRIMGTTLLAIAVASFILYFYALTVIDTDYLRFTPDARQISDVLLPVILAASLTSIVAGLLLALFLPQKIAGPIHRIEQDLLEVRTGDLTKSVTLRYADILKDLAQSINMTVHDFRNMVNDVKESSNTLEAKIIEGDAEEIKKALADHKKSLDSIIS